MDTHWTTANISSACQIPPFHSCAGRGEKVHLMPSKLGIVQAYCAAHCPHCNPPALPERTGEVTTLEGEQGGLFNCG